LKIDELEKDEETQRSPPDLMMYVSQREQTGESTSLTNLWKAAQSTIISFV